jgi:apolipoprotein N-acyltransferase
MTAAVRPGASDAPPPIAGTPSAAALAALAGALYFAGFAGFDLWPLALWLAAGGYGPARIAEVERENAVAPALRVGIVQENLGLREKREEPALALARHLAASRPLSARGVDLLVWPESAVAYPLPDDLRNVRAAFPAWDVDAPVIFGALTLRDEGLYNTARLAGADGALRATTTR